MEGKYLLIIDYGIYEGHKITRHETVEALIEAISQERWSDLPIMVAKELDMKLVITEEE